MVNTEPTADELFAKHDAALRAFIVNPDFDARSALYQSHVGLEKRRRELAGAELTAFSQRYWDQVVRVYSEMRT
jgi:hypothetical protein